MNRCSKCGTTFEEIATTGFVGCEHCYDEIDKLRQITTDMFGGKKYGGRLPKKEN